MKLISPMFALLFLTSLSQAIDPPVKMWERINTDIEKLYDIELVSTGGFICAGYDNDGNCIFRFNDDADLLWAAGSTYVWRANDVDELPGGGFIATGSDYVVLNNERTGERVSSALFIQKFDQNGSSEWIRVYQYSTTKEEGFSIAALPDGGYAVCGKVNGTGSSVLGDAWILRTDANGDTLWTDIWGTYATNWGQGVEYDPINDWIVVAAFGKSEELPSNGPHLLYYSLDGEYLFGTNYYPSLVAEVVRGFVPSIDGGYAFLSRVGTGSGWGTLTHTDALGEIQWSESVSALGYNDNLGLGFAQIDGGYLCCGYDGYSFWDSPDSVATDDPQTQDGSLTRFDAYGNELWHINNEMGHFNHFYSAVQLPQGGYIAAGTYTGSGYLVRYAPETGIEEGTTLPEIVTLDAPSPNPFSSSLNISYSLPEAMQASLAVYDITGRLVGAPEDGVLDAGEHTSVWDSGELPSGCYVVMLRTERGVFSRYATLVR